MRRLTFLKDKFSVGGWQKSVRISLVLAIGLLTGCSDLEYSAHKVGELKGRLIIEWINSDTFRFIRHKSDPLRFTRFDGTTIIPGDMITDGGSVPAALKAVKTYSPWGFGPAFVIHDWLFQMKSCKLKGYEKLTLEKSADIMAEIIKTMMENKKYGAPDKWTLYSMHQAVKSRFAKDMWDNGVCVPVPMGAAKRRAVRGPVPYDAPVSGSGKTSDESGDGSALDKLSPKMDYSGEKAKMYKKKMEVVKKAMRAPAQFTFEHSY